MLDAGDGGDTPGGAAERATPVALIAPVRWATGVVASSEMRWVSAILTVDEAAKEVITARSAQWWDLAWTEGPS